MSKQTANTFTENDSVDLGYGGFRLNAGTFNPLYGASDTVQVDGLFGLNLIRAF